MRNDWTETTLGEVCRLVKGISYKSDELVAVGEGLPFINLKSIGRGGGFRADGLKWFLGKHKQEQVVRAGDLVLCCTDLTKEKAILGYPLLVPKLVEGDEFCISLDMAALIVDKNLTSNAFLYLVLQGRRMREFMTSHSSGTTVMHLQTRSVGDAKFSLPPLLEQKRIVDMVSSVDAYIDALQQQADTARTARNAVLHELLSAGGDDWTETTLGEIGATGFFSDGDWVESKDQDPEGDYRLLQLADIGDGVFLDKSSRWLNEEQFQRLRCTALAPNDILIARMPDPIARACLFPDHLPVSATVVDVAILRCGPGQFPEFLVMLINDVTFRAAANSLITGTTRQRISRSNLSALTFALPPLAEQKRIVDIVSSMDDVIQSTEQAVADAKNLRSGLLSDLLSGDHEIPASYDVFVGAA